MMTIAILSDLVINQIAAGEVVENPSSVVKELIDNAIDAQSHSIHIEILYGGLHEIRIEDDGCGMSRLDAEMSLLRHATSKIRQLSDLDALQTMGFRGEALAAIASVAKVEIHTSNGQEGTRIFAEGGKIQCIEPCARKQGTTITVKSLFFNTPARRRFQKSAQANLAQIVRVVRSLAFSHPQLAFTLRSNQESLLSLDANTWQGRVCDLMVPESNATSFWMDTDAIQGWLGPANEARSTRSGQHFFINQRPIFSPMIAKAVQEGYGTRLAEKSYPSVVLFLKYSPDLFDVNVHPQKREVRFRDESQVFSLIRQTIERTFLPSVAPSFGHELRFTPSFMVQKMDPWERSNETATPIEIEFASGGSSKGRALAVIGGFLLILRDQELFVVDLREACQSISQNSCHSQKLLIPICLLLSHDEVIRMAEFLERCEKIGIEARQVGQNSIAFDTLPGWLSQGDVEFFFDRLKRDAEQGLLVDETVRRFLIARPMRLTLEEAEYLWNHGSFLEVSFLTEDLENLILRKKERSNR